jgi:signal peptidase I
MDRYAVVKRLPASAAPVDRAPLASEPARGAARKLARRGLDLLFVAMMAAATLMLVPAALGFHRYVIETGSMTGTYDRGSIVFDRPVPVSALKVGDPITYAPPPGFTSQRRVTHRIWWIGRGVDGQRVFRTKGDANRAPDAWKFSLSQPTQDRVVTHVPYLGYVFMILNVRIFRMILIGIPAVIIAIMMMSSLWREAGEAARRQRLAEAGWRQIEAPAGNTTVPPLERIAVRQTPIRVDLGFLKHSAESRHTQPTDRPADELRLRPGDQLVVPRLAGNKPSLRGYADRPSWARRLSPANSAAICRQRIQALHRDAHDRGGSAPSSVIGSR